MAEIRSLHPTVRAGWASSIALAMVFAAVVVGPSVARADWGFTHWGMTPEQVVSASGGTAHLIAPANRQRDDAAKLRDGLIARYGQPHKDSAFGPLRTLTWLTPDKIELAINQTPWRRSSHTAPQGGDGRKPSVGYPARSLQHIEPGQ